MEVESCLGRELETREARVAHSFAKNANEWGTRMLMLHLLIAALSPTLRKNREGWGSHCVVVSAEGWASPQVPSESIPQSSNKPRFRYRLALFDMRSGGSLSFLFLGVT